MDKPEKKRMNKWGILLWGILHVAIIALGLNASPWKIDSNLFSVLPPSQVSAGLGDADAELSRRTMGQMTVLVGHADFEKAKAAADEFDRALRGNGQLEKISYLVPDSSMDEARSFAREYRYALQGEPFMDRVRQGGGVFLKQNALEKIYGGFSMASLENLDEDPFLLSAQAFEDVLGNLSFMSKNVELRDERLVLRDSLRTYVMWSASLVPGASTFGGDGSALQIIEQKISELKAADSALVVATTGVPFHSYESSSRAQLEVAVISGVSIVLLLLLILSSYRSAVPLALTLFSIGVAIVSALSVSWTLFGSIHIFTFVFGTSVIGVSIDYAIHFFTGWKIREERLSGRGVRGLIFKGLVLGFMTTELSYLALTFAPFPLLRQMAVFSMAGLASSFLTITLLFAALPAARTRAPAVFALAVVSKALGCYGKWLGVFKTKKWASLAVVAVIVAGAAVGVYRVQWGTDLKSLYTMSSERLAQEKLSMELLDFGSSGSYFLVKGGSVQEVLEREYAFCKRLERERADGVLQNYLAISRFIPPRSVQQKNFEILSRAMDSLTVAEMYKDLGLQSDSAFRASMGQGLKVLEPESKLPANFEKLLNSLWIGTVGDSYYSAVMPLHVHDAAKLSGLAGEGIYFMDKVSQINENLTRLSLTALALVGLAFVLVFAVLFFIYGFSGAFSIMRIPVCASCLAVALFGYLGIPFNFFATVGIILTLGIGIDYSLFFREGRGSSVTVLAIALSALTTILSFGSLSFSGFSPVSTFGLSVFLGILFNFILSPFAGSRVK